MRPLRKKSVKRPVILVDEVPFQVEEAYKSLRTNLQFLSADRKIKKIVITSASPLDGKTTVAVNLAISMGKAGHKVLLIDADLRKPRINRVFRIKASPGLTNILVGNENGGKPAEAIFSSSEYGIDMLVSGPVPPNPSELLGSEKMRHLLETLGNAYDYIIMDTPPATLITDAVVLSKYADGTVVVVAHKRSKHEMVDGTIEALKSAGINIVGTILTDVDMKKMSRRYSAYRYHKYTYYQYQKHKGA